jgi:hypothetical protein
MVNIKKWCTIIGPNTFPSCRTRCPPVNPSCLEGLKTDGLESVTVAPRNGEIGTPRSNTERTHATRCCDRLLSTPAASLSHPVPQRAAMLSRCGTPCLHLTILSFDGVVGRQRRAAARLLTERLAPHGVSDRSGRRAVALHPCGRRG